MSEAIKKRFGKCNLSAVGVEEVRSYCAYMRTTERKANGDPLSPSTIKHRYDVLRIIFNDAESMGYLSMTQNPFRYMKQKDTPISKHIEVEWMDIEQETAFMGALAAAPTKWRVLFTLLLRTGLRRGEVVGLQWQDVDTNKNLLHIQRNVTPATKGSGEKLHIGRPKNGKTRIVPITAATAEMLMDWKGQQAAEYDCIQQGEAFVFSNDANLYRAMYPSTPTSWLHDFEARNGLPDFSPHDLRRSFASRAQMAGVDVASVAAVLGHSSTSVTLEHYSGTDEEAKRRAVETIEHTAG